MLSQRLNTRIETGLAQNLSEFENRLTSAMSNIRETVELALSIASRSAEQNSVPVLLTFHSKPGMKRLSVLRSARMGLKTIPMVPMEETGQTGKLKMKLTFLD